MLSQSGGQRSISDTRTFIFSRRFHKSPKGFSAICASYLLN